MWVDMIGLEILVHQSELQVSQSTSRTHYLNNRANPQCSQIKLVLCTPH